MQNPRHSSELLRTWIDGENLAATQVADHIQILHTTSWRTSNGHLGVTAEMDLRLYQRFNTHYSVTCVQCESRQSNMVLAGSK